MTYNLYDSSDPNSIYNYAKKIVGKTFNDICEDYELLMKEESFEKVYYENKKRKGGLGELVEERYFNYKSNNDSNPDFKEAGVELKVTPYKINKNGSISSKERMILTMINYFTIVKEEFYESGLWDKSKLILMIFYLYEKEIRNRLNYKIDYVHLYSPAREDLKVIIEDYNLIRNKILEGKAHELSEGDTLYLGAATKAASSKNLTTQPYSNEKAKPRAFSFKNSYMTYILNNYVTQEKNTSEKIIKELSNETFESYVLNKINKNIGLEDKELFKIYYEVNSDKEFEKFKSGKSSYSNLAFRMLGIKSNKAEEFEKANVVVKSIRINEKGKIKESMSFPAFKITELVSESWEESEVYNYFSTTKFLFMVFKKNSGENYFFKKGIFWNMPMKTIDKELKDDWNKFVNKFNEGVKFKPKYTKNGKLKVNNNLPKKSETNILHVRPHALKSAHLIGGIKYGNGDLEKDSDELLNGDKMTKQSFWLNNDYILNIIKHLIFL